VSEDTLLPTPPSKFPSCLYHHSLPHAHDTPASTTYVAYLDLLQEGVSFLLSYSQGSIGPETGMRYHSDRLHGHTHIDYGKAVLIGPTLDFVIVPYAR
jgi:hypothetical protein